MQANQSTCSYPVPNCLGCGSMHLVVKLIFIYYRQHTEPVGVMCAVNVITTW